jgi:serine/threonine protein kinase
LFQLDHDFHPKLGDFGLSRLLAAQGASASNMSGTPTHMAPEQHTPGAKHNPIKADLCSCGMLLYELATNKVCCSTFLFNSNFFVQLKLFCEGSLQGLFPWCDIFQN